MSWPLSWLKPPSMLVNVLSRPISASSLSLLVVHTSSTAAAPFSTSVVCRKMYDYEKMSIKEMEEEMRREQKKKKEQEYALYPLVAASAFASGYGVYHTIVKYFPEFSLVRLPRRDEVERPMGKIVTVVPVETAPLEKMTISKLAEADEDD